MRVPADNHKPFGGLGRRPKEPRTAYGRFAGCWKPARCWLLIGVSTPKPCVAASWGGGWGRDPRGLGWDSGCAGDPQVKLFILDLSAMLASLGQAKPTPAC